jgi:hypothetical protein
VSPRPSGRAPDPPITVWPPSVHRLSLNDSVDIDHQLRWLRAADTSAVRSLAECLFRSTRERATQFPAIAERTAAGDIPD